MALLAVICLLAQPARAGTCNSSYTDTLPQLSGSVGSVPADIPGQSIQGLITSVSASGTNFTFGYTPTGGSQSFSVISLGALSGVSCTGSWSGAKITEFTWENVWATMNTSIRINGVSNVITCTGMQSSLSTSFTSTDGLQKVSVGSGETYDYYKGEDSLLLRAYLPSQNRLGTSAQRLSGSCRASTYNSPPSYSTPTTYTDLATNQFHMVVNGSGGINNIEYFLDGVSKGNDNTFPFDFAAAAGSVTPGVHAFMFKATFALGTITRYERYMNYTPIMVATGNAFACATGGDTTLQCWGKNNYGQLGAGSAATSSATPLTVSDGFWPISGVIDVSVGIEAACAVTWGGGVKCWGKNSNGILRATPGTLPSSNIAVEIYPIDSGAKSVRVGGKHACALFNNGTVTCWGHGAYGQLGNGAVTATVVNPYTTPFSTAVKIDVARDTTYVVTAAGALYAFGQDTYGQLGNGATLANALSPVVVQAAGVTDIWAGKYGACARVGSTIKCWGDNSFGQVGTGSSSPAVQPTPLATTMFGSSSTVISLPGGDGTTCVVSTVTPGTGSCLGYNALGQLGMGTTSTVEYLPQTPSGYNSGTVQMSGGYINICSYHNGHIKCAGDNTYGQIGDPAAPNPTLTPYQVLNH